MKILNKKTNKTKQKSHNDRTNQQKKERKRIKNKPLALRVIRNVFGNDKKIFMLFYQRVVRINFMT